MNIIVALLISYLESKVDYIYDIIGEHYSYDFVAKALKDCGYDTEKAIDHILEPPPEPVIKKNESSTINNLFFIEKPKIRKKVKRRRKTKIKKTIKSEI